MNIYILAFLGIIFGSVLAYIYETIIPIVTRKKSLIIKGYKLHHSLYGVILIAISFILGFEFSTKIFVLFFGIGIIVEHYLTGGGFDLVTKEKHP